MRTFKQWLEQQNNDYSKAVADNIQKTSGQQNGAGNSIKQNACATKVIQQAALKAVNPSNVADAIATTGKSVAEKKMKK